MLLLLSQVLKALSKLRRDADLLDALKPNSTPNDIKRSVIGKGGLVQVASTRYKSHIRSDTKVKS